MPEDDCARPALALDLDNVIAATDPVIRRIIRDLHGIELSQSDIVEFDYWRCGITRDQSDSALAHFHEAACDEPTAVDGAKAALEVLGRTHEILLLTARPPSTASQTEQWIASHELQIARVIHTTNKSEYASVVDAAVEDHRETAYQFASLGVRSFLFDYPWNQPTGPEPELLSRVRGWHEVVDRLRKDDA